MNWRRLLNPAFLGCIVVLFGVGTAMPIVVKQLGIFLIKLPIEATQKLSSVPAKAGSWEALGPDKPYSEEIQTELGTQNYIDRVYVSHQGAESGKPPTLLQLHLAYYTGTIDTVPHVPERCLVGGGWSIAGGPWLVPVPLDASGWAEDEAATADVRRSIDSNATIYTIRLGPSSKAPGNRVRLPRDAKNISMLITEFTEPRTSKRMFAGYFFIANGGVAGRAEDVRLLAFDRRSDYAYYLKVQTSSEQVKSKEELAQRTAELLNELLPDMLLCVPDWVDVQRGDYPPDNPRRGKSGAIAAGGSK